MFDKVELEKRIGKIIPDVVLYKNNIPLLVEIAVTHYVDDEKRKELEKNKLSTIEINLSEYKKDFIKLSRGEIERIIIDSVENKVWIYNRKVDGERESIIKECKEFVKNREELIIKKWKQRQQCMR